MKVIVCLDDKNGMMFNGRRQSQDAKLRQYVLAGCKDNTLWMTPYSARQFENETFANIKVDEYCLDKAKENDFCFIENKKLLPYEKQIEKIIVFRWNRVYPNDTVFDIPLSCGGWKGKEVDRFVGNSHEEITVEVFER